MEIFHWLFWSGLGDIACFDLNYKCIHETCQHGPSARTSVKQLVDSKHCGWVSFMRTEVHSSADSEKRFLATFLWRTSSRLGTRRSVRRQFLRTNKGCVFFLWPHVSLLTYAALAHSLYAETTSNLTAYAEHAVHPLDIVTGMFAERPVRSRKADVLEELLRIFRAGGADERMGGMDK